MLRHTCRNSGYQQAGRTGGVHHNLHIGPWLPWIVPPVFDQEMHVREFSLILLLPALRAD